MFGNGSQPLLAAGRFLARDEADPGSEVTPRPSTDLFRVTQPDDSAAGLAGFCVNSIYTSAAGAKSVVAACQDYLEAVDVVGDPHPY